ncbi:Sec-independent protein translocase protein TatB [Terrihabitans sp. B22-R8]|uniref:Sec-independent protein translocase protein TatB n=1 Tax=Terrihabitans sp. B22-R8 TaxID=3425128 RepID=UPI00403C68EB
MFEIGWSEMLLVAVVAIVVIGPKDLPAALRQAGKWMGAVRRMASEFQGHVNEAMKEAELDELRQELNDLKRTARGFSNPVHSIRDEMRTAIEGKPKADVTTAAAGMATAGPLSGEVPSQPAIAPTHEGGNEPPPSRNKAVTATADDLEVAAPRPADLPVPSTPAAEIHFDPEPAPAKATNERATSSSDAVLENKA